MRAGASTIMAILYDYPTLPSAHDEAIDEIDKTFQQGSQAASLGGFLVEFLPWMLHIPRRYGLSLQFQDRNNLQRVSRFAKWKREALEHSAKRAEVYLRLFNRVRIDLVCPRVRFNVCGARITEPHR